MQDWKGILIRMKRKNKIKYVILAGAVSAVVLSACSHGQTADITAAEQSAAEETQTTEPLTVSASEAAAAGAGGEAEEGGEHTLAAGLLPDRALMSPGRTGEMSVSFPMRRLPVVFMMMPRSI